MNKNSKEYKKLKKEMDEYLKNKEKQREKQKIDSLGFSRGIYPSENYQKILKKRYKANKIHSNISVKIILFIALIILAIIILFITKIN